MRLAAIDLGSNSFRLEIARVEDGNIFSECRWKETVRLAAGLDENGYLSEAAQKRALTALSRIAEKVQGFPPAQVRAVGTQTLRAAENSAEFLVKAEKVLGYKIEILRGKEEARLVYMGCSFALPASDEIRLIVDIGGASTECVVGRGHEVLDGESFHIGCVNTSVSFFKDGNISAKSFRHAILAAEFVLDGNVSAFTKGHWSEAYGSSGTVSAVSSILRSNGLTDGTITLDALEVLKEKIISSGRIDNLHFDGLREDRREVLAGGVAVLLAVFKKLRIDKMKVSGGALRYGLLYNLAGRQLNSDPRTGSVSALLKRTHSDEKQSERMASFSLQLLGLLKPHASAEQKQALEWASRLYEVGLFLSRSDYHKHSEYVIRNSDLAGFSRSEQERIAALVLSHRGQLRKVEAQIEEKSFRELVFVIRLAAIFVHARHDIALPKMSLSEAGKVFGIHLPEHWCREHPLTKYMIEQEALAWEKVGYQVKLSMK